MSQDQNHQNHATWERKYHAVFTPKKEAAVWVNQAAPRHCISRACQAQGMQDRRRALDARPCAHPDIDPAEIFGGGDDRISEREKLDRGAQNVERKLRNFLGHKFWARGYFVSTVMACGANGTQ